MDWFVLRDLQIFPGGVYHPKPPQAQSLFLVPIVFGINWCFIDWSYHSKIKACTGTNFMVEGQVWNLDCKCTCGLNAQVLFRSTSSLCAISVVRSELEHCASSHQRWDKLYKNKQKQPQQKPLYFSLHTAREITSTPVCRIISSGTVVSPCITGSNRSSAFKLK